MTEETGMNGVAYLTRIARAEARVRKLENRAAHLEALATDISQHLTGQPVRHGQAEADRTGRLAAEISDTKQEAEEAREEAGRIREEVSMAILRIENPGAQEVLMLRYVHGMSYPEIATALNYSESWVYQARRAGIREIEEMIGER